MKHILIALNFAGLTVLTLQSGMAGETPSFAWVQGGGGISVDYAVAAAIDEAGNSFLGARVQSSSATFGGQTLTNPCVVVAKYDDAGAFQWLVPLTPTANVGNLLLGADQAGNCYAAGYLTGPITIGSSNLTIGPAKGDLFLAKFSPTGTLLWAKAAGAGIATNQAYHPSLSVGASGDCLLSGSYHDEFSVGTSLIGFPGAHARPFVVRCSGGGDWLWVRDPCATTNSYFVMPQCVVGHPNGDYYLGGYFGSVVQFGNQTFTNPPSTTIPPEPNDFFLIKCDQNGNVLWAKSVPDCGPISLATDSGGNCYVLGGRFGIHFGGSISFDGCVVTNTGMFLLKLDPAGNVLWCRNSADMGSEPLVAPAGTYRLAMDAADQLYVAGYFYGTAVVGNLTITNPATPQYFKFTSSFLAKYDSAGTAIWAKAFGGSDLLEYPFPLDFPYDKTALAVNSEGRCCVVGAINITNALFDGFGLATAGSEDAFIAQVEPDPPILRAFQAGTDFVLRWPTNQSSYSLQKSASLANGSWSPVTNAVLTMGVHHFVTHPIAGDSRFFRLQRP